MIENLSKPVRRLLAFAILVALPLFAWSLIVAPLLGMIRDRQETIDARADRLARLDEVIGRIPALQAINEEMTRRLTTEGSIWEEKSDAVVTAKMEEVLRGVVEQNGGVLSRSVLLPVRTAQNFRIVRIQFKISGTLETIEKTFRGIAEAEPLLFVDAFRIVDPANAPRPDQPPLLNLDVEVMGYLRLVKS